MSDRYILFDPKVDYIFKRIFGIERNKSLLISLINAILRGFPHIVDLSLVNPELTKVLERNKDCRLDVKARGDDGTMFNVELQCRNTYDLPNRALYYASRLFSDQLNVKESYNTPKVISIWILGENVTKRSEAINDAYMTFTKTDRDPYEVMTDHMRIVFIELEKYEVKDPDLRDLLNGWLSFLKNPIDMDSEYLKDGDICKARDELEFISTDEEEREWVESVRNKLNDNTSDKTIAYEQGREEGARQKAIETAKQMLKKNIDISTISYCTGLPIEEIKDIR